MDAESREMCLPRTRVDILQELFASLIGPDSSRRVIWLCGLAGSGKSTILNTITQYSSNLHRCGAFLFWNRNDPINSDPRRVIRTLAYQLAQSNPAFAHELALRIKSSPQIMKSSLDDQFRSLLQEPPGTVAASHDSGPIIIILDALDECGTPETRKNLLDVLTTWLAKLLRMFRLLVASRDEPDIRVTLSRTSVILYDARVDDESAISDISQFFPQCLSSNAPAFEARGLLIGQSIR
jgi:ATP/maltotriose-dependent transcriptional regulator MalT